METNNVSLWLLQIPPKFPIWMVSWNIPETSSITASRQGGVLQCCPTLNPGFIHVTMCNQIISHFSFLNCYKIPGEVMADDRWQSLVSQLTAPKEPKIKKILWVFLIISTTCASEKWGFWNVFISKIPWISSIEQTSLSVWEAI